MGGTAACFLRGQLHHAIQRQIARYVDELAEIFEEPTSGGPSDWTYWGYYRLVQVNGNAVLLFKSNTHLDWPGATYLEALIKLLATDVKPNLVLSIGTAGGAKAQDHIGTVRAVSAGTLYKSGQPPASWPEYKNGWKASGAILGNAEFLPAKNRLSTRGHPRVAARVAIRLILIRWPVFD